MKLVNLLKMRVIILCLLIFIVGHHFGAKQSSLVVQEKPAFDTIIENNQENFSKAYLVLEKNSEPSLVDEIRSLSGVKKK